MMKAEVSARHTGGKLVRLSLLLSAGWILLAGSVAVSGSDRNAAFHGSVVDSPAPDFTLSDQNGKPFRLADRRGRVLLLFFGYTHCPDTCPLTLSIWKKVREALGGRAKDVDFVYVTVDPKRDTPERLREQLIAFSPDFIGLTGTEAVLSKVYDDYRVPVKEAGVSATATRYGMRNHTTVTIVIDRHGRWRLDLPYAMGINDIAADIQKLLNEG